MASAARLAANRANAQRSTGPRTEDGKARSRMNALRHGLAAEEVLTFDEDAADFARFAEEMRDALAPEGEAELVLVDRIAMGNWRLRRVWRQEAASLNKRALAEMHERVREEIYEQVLAELKKNPPSEEERKKMWPPYDADTTARRIVWGMSEAALEEAAVGARAAAKVEAEAAGAGTAPELEGEAPSGTGLKLDQPMWPAPEMAALSRYEASIERALHRATLALDKLQARRREIEAAARAEREEPVAQRREGEAGAAAPSLSRQQRRAAARKHESTERTQARHAPRAPAGAANGSSPS